MDSAQPPLDRWEHRNEEIGRGLQIDWNGK